jgi:hypothetical protein
MTFNQGVGRSSRPWVTIFLLKKPLFKAVSFFILISYNLHPKFE